MSKHLNKEPIGVDEWMGKWIDRQTDEWEVISILLSTLYPPKLTSKVTIAYYVTLTHLKLQAHDLPH